MKDNETLRGEVLSKLVRDNNLKKGAELGVWKGNTFQYLILNCEDLHMIGVDAYMEMPNNVGEKSEKYLISDKSRDWNHEKHYKSIIEFCDQHNDRTHFIRDLTDNACEKVEDQSLDFLFIDAHHTEESVSNDIKNWLPKIKRGGFITGDDYHWFWPGVIKAVDSMFNKKDIKILNKPKPSNIWCVKII